MRVEPIEQVAQTRGHRFRLQGKDRSRAREDRERT